MGATDAELREALRSAAPELPAAAPPELGQHTREILAELLGYDGAAIDAMAADDVVQLG